MSEGGGGLVLWYLHKSTSGVFASVPRRLCAALVERRECFNIEYFNIGAVGRFPQQVEKLPESRRLYWRLRPIITKTDIYTYFEALEVVRNI